MQHASLEHLTPQRFAHRSIGSRRFVQAVLLGCILLAGMAFAQRISYELAGPYTADTTLYWAVSRGILNGIAPWSGLFETKPPGVFLLGVWSLKLTGSMALTHLVQALALLCIALFPPLLLLARGRAFDKSARAARRLLWLVLGLLGLLLAQYVAERSGEVQVESFGAAFAMLAVFVMASPVFDRRPRLGVMLAALGWLGACGMKEPFIFPLLAAALLLLRTRKAWWLRCIAPLILALAIGGLFILQSGWAHDYLQVYLKYMSGYSGRGGSPWLRATELWHIWDDMNGFAHGLGYALCLLGCGPVLISLLQSPDVDTAMARALRFAGAWLLAALAVGLGGEFYNHHHVFAIPLLFALLALGVPALLAGAHTPLLRMLWIGTTVLVCYATLALPLLELPRRLTDLKRDRAVAMREAEHVDAIMDRARLDRYMFIGGNGPQLFGFTRHSPMGPMFFQLQDFIDNSKAFRQSYFDNLDKAQLVVMDQPLDSLREETQITLDRFFTQQAWPETDSLPRPEQKYAIWYRKRPTTDLARQ